MVGRLTAARWRALWVWCAALFELRREVRVAIKTLTVAEEATIEADSVVAGDEQCQHARAAPKDDNPGHGEGSSERGIVATDCGARKAATRE